MINEPLMRQIEIDFLGDGFRFTVRNTVAHERMSAIDTDRSRMMEASGTYL